jgi:hypothetical protein
MLMIGMVDLQVRSHLVKSVACDRRDIGQYVRSKLGPMLVNLYRTADRWEEEQRRFRSDQHRELVYERAIDS